MDRATDFGSVGWGFESLRARVSLSLEGPPVALCAHRNRRLAKRLLIGFEMGETPYIITGDPGVGQRRKVSDE